jgi:hypothetical protein
MSHPTQTTQCKRPREGPFALGGYVVFDSGSTIFSLRSKFGGLGRNRTTDTRIFNPLLYQLSYQAFKEGKL